MPPAHFLYAPTYRRSNERSAEAHRRRSRGDHQEFLIPVPLLNPSCSSAGGIFDMSVRRRARRLGAPPFLRTPQQSHPAARSFVGRGTLTPPLPIVCKFRFADTFILPFSLKKALSFRRELFSFFTSPRRDPTSRIFLRPGRFLRRYPHRPRLRHRRRVRRRSVQRLRRGDPAAPP